MRIAELERRDRDLRVALEPGRCPRTRSRAVAQQQAARQHHRVAAFPRRPLRIAHDLVAALLEEVGPRDLLALTLGMARLREQHLPRPAAFEHERGVLREHRVVCTVNERQRHDRRARALQRADVVGVLRRRRGVVDRADRHVRVDRPRDLIPTRRPPRMADARDRADENRRRFCHEVFVAPTKLLAARARDRALRVREHDTPNNLPRSSRDGACTDLAGGDARRNSR